MTYTKIEKEYLNRYRFYKAGFDEFAKMRNNHPNQFECLDRYSTLPHFTGNESDELAYDAHNMASTSFVFIGCAAFANLQHLLYIARDGKPASMPFPQLDFVPKLVIVDHDFRIPLLWNYLKACFVRSSGLDEALRLFSRNFRQYLEQACEANQTVTFSDKLIGHMAKEPTDAIQKWLGADPDGHGYRYIKSILENMDMLMYDMQSNFTQRYIEKHYGNHEKIVYASNIFEFSSYLYAQDEAAVDHKAGRKLLNNIASWEPSFTIHTRTPRLYENKSPYAWAPSEMFVLAHSLPVSSQIAALEHSNYKALAGNVTAVLPRTSVFTPGFEAAKNQPKAASLDKNETTKKQRYRRNYAGNQ